MALKRNERYPGRYSNPTSDHPQGAFKNRTAPSAQDGSYLEQDWSNDWDGFFGRLLTVAGITPNGAVDTAQSSQYYDSLISILRNTSSGTIGDASNQKISITTASASATFTCDEIIVGETVGGKQYRLSNVNKVINISTTGAGGMDTGSVPASGWVAIYVIYNPTTTTSSLLAVNTTSTIAPVIYGGANMPAGYTASALVSVWRTSSSLLRIGYQRGRRFSTPRVDVLTTSSNPGGYTPISLTSAVPQNAISCTGYAFCNSGTGAGSATLVIAGDNAGVGFFQAYGGNTGNVGSDIYFETLLPVVQNIYYQFSWTTSGVSNATVGINGYEI